MMFSKTQFVKVNRRRGGGNRVQEYVRNDIFCGISGCPACRHLVLPGAAAPLDAFRMIMIPDASIVLHSIDVMEDPRMSNVILLTSVLNSIRQKNRGVYARVERMIGNPVKLCSAFANVNHEGTHCTILDGESEDEFSRRCVLSAASWFSTHARLTNPNAIVALVTHNTELAASCEALCSSEEMKSSLRCMSLLEYAEKCPTLRGCDLVDRLRMREAAAACGPDQSKHFEEYMTADEVERGVQSGALIQGRLKVSEGSCFVGDVRASNQPYSRIRIFGKTAMNRAIHDDVVAVRPLPVSKWRAPAGTAGAATNDEAAALQQGFTPCGEVVAIVEARRRAYCGSIDMEDAAATSGSSGAVSILFQPKSNNIPRIRIVTRQLCDLKSKRLVVVIDEWPAHCSAPLGHYVDVLGDIGDKETEAKVILMERDIPHYDFSQAVLDCLPKGQWCVDPAEEDRRVDLRDRCVCSIDPLGCRDIDDALHFRRLGNGRIEVGVHIADVAHFVEEGNALDEEAAKRSTSVYLVDRRINMLPQLLTENLCSIVANEDRYAFSFVWEFENDTNPMSVSEWCGKTIIRSRAALYYGDAQKMIEDSGNQSEIAMGMRGLMSLSRQMKARREAAGALFLVSQQFKFTLDNDHVNPVDMTKYQSFEANSMVEEWMLFANAAAARKCYDAFPPCALLRRHEAPDASSFDTLNEAVERKTGHRLDVASSLLLNQSFDKCTKSDDPFFGDLVRMLATRCLRQAQYFASGEFELPQFHHYGLAMPMYTHFTSPIRRYADMIVHRQLAAAIGAASAGMCTDFEKMKAAATVMNYRHEQAQKAGRDSQNLYSGFFLRTFPDGQIPTEDGYVIKVNETHLTVLVAKYGQEGRIPIEEMKRPYALLDKVRVTIKLLRDGDVLRTKLHYCIIEDDPDTGADNNDTRKRPRAEE